MMEALNKAEIIELLKVDLKLRCAAFIADLDNPLVSEVDFLEKEIQICKSGMAGVEGLNNKHHHGGASILESELIAWKYKIQVAEECKSELEKVIIPNDYSIIQYCLEYCIQYLIDKKHHKSASNGAYEGKKISLMEIFEGVSKACNLSKGDRKRLRSAILAEIRLDDFPSSRKDNEHAKWEVESYLKTVSFSPPQTP